MGGAVKQIAVVTVMAIASYYTGGFIQILTGSTLAGAVAGAAAAIAVAAVAGKALGVGQPNLDDTEPISTYATSSLQNVSNNNNVVPVAYGEVRLGGVREFSDLITADNDSLYEIITFTNHEINSFEELFANNELMTQGTGPDTDKWRFANDKILVKVYTVKATPIKAITAYSGGVWTEANLSSLSFQNTTFLDTDIPDGISFIVVYNKFHTADNNQRKDITARLQGKKIRPINSATEIGITPIYSINPAEIELDFLTDSENFNEDDSKIDIESFYASKLLNVTYGFYCNIAFGAKTNLSAALQEIKATNRSNLIYSQGFWKVKQDEKNKTITFNITGDDIVSGSFSWSQSSARDIGNKVTVSYINPSDQWQTKTSSIENTDLRASDGRIYNKEIQLRGVTNQAQADIIAELSLNQYRYTEDEDGNRINVTPMNMTFTTTIKNSTLEVGDMGTIDYFEIPNIKKLVIMSIRTKQSGELEVIAREYAETHYKDTNGNFII